MVELTSISTIEDILHKYGIRPQKRFGQNFLISRQALQKIVAAADINSTDTILEIGPGIGVLTMELARRAKQVVAVEKDQTIVQILRDLVKQSGVSNVEVVQKDARDISPDDFRNWELVIRNYKVVANLPYYIATPMIRKFLEVQRQPKYMVFTIQKEVAQRICAKPPHMSILALSVQFYADSEIIAAVPNSSFWPKPEVDGAIIKITPHRERPAAEFSKQFFTIIRAGFAQPRKKLISNLASNLSVPKEKIRAVLQSQNIPDGARAESVELSGWISITQTLDLSQKT